MRARRRHPKTFWGLTAFSIFMLYLVVNHWIVGLFPSPTLPETMAEYSAIPTMKIIANIVNQVDNIFGQFSQIEFGLGIASGIGAYFTRK